MDENILEYWKTADPQSLEALFDIAPIFMQSVQPTGKIINISKFWADRLGYTREELIGTLSFKLMTKETQRYAQSVVIPNFLESCVAREVEYEYTAKNGEIVPVSFSSVGVLDKEGRYLNSLTILHDMSDKRRAESELTKSKRLEAMSQMVSGVAHDFNNVLSIIRGNLELVSKDLLQERNARFLEEAILATERGKSTTQQLLTFGRQATVNTQKLVVSDFIKRFEPTLRAVFPGGLDFQVEKSVRHLAIECDEKLLKASIINLINNSAHALNGQAEPIKVSVSTPDLLGIKGGSSPTADNGTIVITVADKGCGMDNGTLSRVLEPFFTTKESEPGAGLGLSMVYGFVKQSGGWLRIETEPNVGTSVHLLFPLIDPVEQPIQQTPAVLAPPITRLSPRYLKGSRIIIVEDEPSLLNVYAHLLNQFGPVLRLFETCDEAADAIKSGVDFDILMTDMVVPGTMQGGDLIRLVRTLRPEVGIVSISGYSNDSDWNSDALVDQALVKPISIRELLDALCKLFVKAKSRAGHHAQSA